MAKKLDIKIRETKDLAAHGLISQSDGCDLHHNRADEILSQGCASQVELWISFLRVENSRSWPVILDDNAGFARDGCLDGQFDKEAITRCIAYTAGSHRHRWRAENLVGGIDSRRFIERSRGGLLVVLEIRDTGCEVGLTKRSSCGRARERVGCSSGR